MNIESDEHLKRFQVESDRAFLAMQTSADQEMEKFLKSYSQDALQLVSFRTPDLTWVSIPPVLLTKAMSGGGGKIKKKAKEVAQKIDKATGGRAGHAAHKLFNEFGDLGDDVKADLQAHAQDARGDVTGVLRSAGMDLGERAKREAAAMREAARKAMAEEKSLKGLADRAKAELQAAKQRIQAELIDAGNDAMGSLEGVAVDKLEELGAEGLEASVEVEERLRNFNPFDDGPPKKLR